MCEWRPRRRQWSVLIHPLRLTLASSLLRLIETGFADGSPVGASSASWSTRPMSLLSIALIVGHQRLWIPTMTSR